MFSRAVKDLKFIGEDADQVFQNITGDGFGYDSDFSFVATMRALLPKRMTDSDKIKFLYRESSYGEAVVKSNSVHDLFNDMYTGLNRSDQIVLLDINHAENGNSILFEKMDDPQNGVEKTYDVRELKDLKQFVLDRKIEARFYISEQRRTTIIVVSHLVYQSYHVLQALIPRCLPWYFTDNTKPDEDEKNLLSSLTKRSAPEYERIIDEFASKVDFRSYKIKRLLGDFEKRSRLEWLRNVDLIIEQYRVDLADNARRHEKLVQEMDGKIVERFGLSTMINTATEESELIDYFLCNKNLRLETVTERRIFFYVKCCLDNFDPEAYSQIAKNPYSDMYRVALNEQSVFGSTEDIKLLFDAILSDEPVLKVNMCSYYEIDTRGSVGVRSHWEFPREYSDCIPNPHIQYYHCLGNHERYIRDALLSGNTIGAIEQCISSAKSINVLESATFPRFVKEVCGSRRNLIRLPDGTCVTPIKAVAWLKEQSEQTTSTEEVEDV